MLILIFDTETTGLPKTKIISQDTLESWPNIVQFSFTIFDTDENKIIGDYVENDKFFDTIDLYLSGDNLEKI